MSTRVDTFEEAIAVVVGAVLLLTVLAGVVGAVWRMVFWGAMHGTGATGHHVLDGPGFELGFGVPLLTVVAWATVVACVLGGSYVVYRELVGQ
jgi:D-alanyl-lipoteichoic acid acyltransferase DltB (MBOAT superfamily)